MLLTCSDEEQSKPRGYITIESESEPRRNAEAETRRTKTQDRSLKAQGLTSKVQDRPAKVPNHPSQPVEDPPDPEEKSGDLRRFASAFVRADQAGTIADQHRFYADSVHFYREGDLSWAGVVAATRRYRQEKQNGRYDTEGAATIKGPVNGGFYIIEQPVSRSRAEGSRVTRGRSLLRLRVVSARRGDWKITSIEETGQ